jgi:enoyl-CoA hydratase
MSKVLFHKNEHAGWITINRAEVHNAIDYDVMEALYSMLTLAEQDDEIKVVVITGAGAKAFCSGGDLQKFHSLYTKAEAKQMLSKMGEILYKIATFPKITVALLNGTAVGGGCELATSCDFRIAVKNKKFGFIQGTLGITTGWGGSTLLLERVEAPVAMKLLATGNIFTTNQGEELGFISQLLSEDKKDEEATLWLKQYTSLSLPVIKAYKSYYVSKLNSHHLKERLHKEIDQCATLWESEEHHEAVQKFLNK